MKSLIVLLLSLTLSFSGTSQVKSGIFKRAVLTDLTTKEQKGFKIYAEVVVGGTEDVVVSLNKGANINKYNFIETEDRKTITNKKETVTLIKAVNTETKVKVFLIFTSDGKFAIRAKDTQIIFLN